MILTGRRIFGYKFCPKFIRCWSGLYSSMSHQKEWHQVKYFVISRIQSGILKASYFIMDLDSDIFISTYQFYQLPLKPFSFFSLDFCFKLVWLIIHLYSCKEEMKWTSLFLSMPSFQNHSLTAGLVAWASSAWSTFSFPCSSPPCHSLPSVT